ncbi:competence protein ComEC, partial [Methylobacterium sp. WL122]
DGAGRIGRLIALGLTTVVGTLGTTLVAQVATAPFATYHFQTVQPFGLIGNALTLPLVSLAVMPAAVLGIVAYPFALDQPVWWLMGLAVRGMLTISGWIEGLGRANVVVPAFGTGALGCLAAALLLATLPVSRLRWLALPPALLGLGLATAPARFDIYVDRQGSGAAVRRIDGSLVALGKPSNFVLEQWLKADGDGRTGAQATGGPTCDRIGCVLRLADGRAVALLKDRRGFAQDCANAAVLITPLSAPPSCAAALVIDRAYLAAHGAVAIRLQPDGFTVSRTREPGRTLPWRPAQARVPAKPADQPVPQSPLPGEIKPKYVPFQGMAPPNPRTEPAPDDPAADGTDAEMPAETLQ